MKKYNRVFVMSIFSLLLSWNIAYSQDFQLTQFYAAPTLMNPGFTGNTQASRIVSNYRNQWTSIPGAFKTYSLSYDTYVAKVNSGFGVRLSHDAAGSAGLGYTNLAALYAYDIRIGYNLSFRPGVSVARTMRHINYNKLVFGDQLATENASTIEPLEDLNLSYFDIGFGGVLYSNKFWLGLSVDHFNNPDISHTGFSAELPTKFAMQGGYKQNVKKLVGKRGYKSILYAFNYKQQADFNQLDFGLYLDNQPYIIGFWYRGIPFQKKYETDEVNQDAFAILMGYSFKRLRVGYSYDITVNSLVSSTSGSHEMSFVYQFDKPHKRKQGARKTIIPCPQF